MLSIKPKTAFTNILEGDLPPMTINGHFDRYTKNHCFRTSCCILIRPYRFCDTYDSFSIIVFLFSDELILFVTS